MRVIYKHDSVAHVRMTDSIRARCPLSKAEAKGSCLIHAHLNFPEKLDVCSGGWTREKGSNHTFQH